MSPYKWGNFSYYKTEDFKIDFLHAIISEFLYITNYIYVRVCVCVCVCVFLIYRIIRIEVLMTPKY